MIFLPHYKWAENKKNQLLVSRQLLERQFFGGYVQSRTYREGEKARGCW